MGELLKRERKHWSPGWGVFEPLMKEPYQTQLPLWRALPFPRAIPGGMLVKTPRRGG